jgi:4-amino-4-deoxy-L-arabinose transferase-like glycosyltransferase
MWDGEFCRTPFRSLAAVVLLLAGFNLTFRINDTAITEWGWLTALSFKTFGITPFALRLTSIVSAWLTVWLIVLWARRAGVAMPAIIGGAVLATSFGFMYVHSGRTGNTDALFALLTTLTAFLVFWSFAHPCARVLLGLVLAAAFLLRGPGVLMPLAIVASVEAWRRRCAAALVGVRARRGVFAVPVSI